MTGGRRSLRRWWADGPLSRPGARWRYSTIVVVVALLASLPALVGAIPVDAKSESGGDAAGPRQASDTIPYTGLASATGQLAVPDLGVGTDVTDLLSQTNRLRVWWAEPHALPGRPGDRHRRERRLPAAGGRSGPWDSDQRLAHAHRRPSRRSRCPDRRTRCPPTSRAGCWSRRPPAEVTSIDARRIAGRTALGTGLGAARPASRLIGQVKVWVDQNTGLPLSVDVRPVGSSQRAFSTALPRHPFKAPGPGGAAFRSHTTIRPRRDHQRRARMLPTTTRRASPCRPTIAGLPQRSPPHPLVATYGEGPTIVAIVAHRPALGGQALRHADRFAEPPADQGQVRHGLLSSQRHCSTGWSSPPATAVTCCSGPSHVINSRPWPWIWYATLRRTCRQLHRASP